MTTNRDLIDDYIQRLYVERDVAGAFENVVDDYIQHNPLVPDGKDAAVRLLTGLFGNPEATFEVQRVLIDGDHAAIHVRAAIPGRPVSAVVDIFRLADGKIVEHWDAIQPVPDESANPHPMF